MNGESPEKAASNGQKPRTKVDFSSVLAAEHDQIRQVRSAGRRADSLDAPPDTTKSLKTTGLALSGGGIRSATFNLGIIQALCERKVLHQFDYLSTVSGGGYIGAWLSAQIYHRCKTGTADELEEKLSPTSSGSDAPKAKEDPSINFLRQYSNYLTPRFGLLSTDTLAAIAAYLRNLVLIQSIVLLLVALVLFIPRMAFLSVKLVIPAAGHGLAIAAAILLLLSAGCIVANLRETNKQNFLARTKFVLLGIIAPATAAAFFIAIDMARQGSFLNTLSLPGWILWGSVLFLIAVSRMPVRVSNSLYDPPASPGLTGSHRPVDPDNAVCGTCNAQAPSWRRRLLNRFLIILFGAAAGAVGGVCLWLVQTGIHVIAGQSGWDGALWFALSVAPFLILQSLALVIVVHLGLVGGIFQYEVQEWWARYGGWLIAVTLGIGGIYSAGVYGPALVKFGGTWLAALGGPIWIVTTLWGLVKGVSYKTSGEGTSITERALTFVPYVFIAGLVIMVSYGLYRALPTGLTKTDDCTTAACVAAKAAPGVSARLTLNSDYSATVLDHPAPASAVIVEFSHAPLAPATTKASFPDAASEVTHQLTMQTMNSLPVSVQWRFISFSHLLRTSPLIFLGALFVWVLLALRVDVNLFSLHNFYRNRLTRCYLGASRMAPPSVRNPHPFTGFDSADDIPLEGLAKRTSTNGAVFTQRPYHILNTALNLSSGENLAWQQRKAGSFFFSPLYCGFELPETSDSSMPVKGFVNTSDYMRHKRKAGTTGDCGPMLGTVVAISGAAASPTWGFHTDPGVAFLLTLFNVRLGRWCPNPLNKTFTPASPRFGGARYIDELFGDANSASEYVYLSDGGHFDNLGIYELVRRRTSVILACDCGADAPLRFDDLADTIRKCSADFGVDIVIDVGQLRLIAGDTRPPCSTSHVVFGTVRYPEANGSPAFDGTLMLVKPTLTQGIFEKATDLINYALTEPLFPQQTTLDQWFDEAQFESYRKLGYLIGLESLNTPLPTSLPDTEILFEEILKDCTGLA